MYRSKQQIIDKVLSAYDGIDKLSLMPHGKPTYSHFYNGVGCAIGCLFTYTEANKLENLSVESTLGSIYNMYKNRHNFPFLIDVIFNKFNFTNYDIKFLEDLQIAHDESRTVEEFIMRVKEL